MFQDDFISPRHGLVQKTSRAAARNDELGKVAMNTLGPFWK
jgi:hypothetical protein